MKVYYYESSAWNEITDIIVYPVPQTRLNQVGYCTVVIRDFEGAKFDAWKDRDFTEMKVEDDSSNILFRGYLKNKRFKHDELTLNLVGLGAILEWTEFNNNYILEQGKVNESPVTGDILTLENLADPPEAFTWPADHWNSGFQDHGLLITDNTTSTTSKTWDASLCTITGEDSKDDAFAKANTKNDEPASYVWAEETAQTYNNIINFDIDGTAIARTNYLQKIEIDFQFGHFITPNGSNNAVYKTELQIKKDSTWITKKTFTTNTWYPDDPIRKWIDSPTIVITDTDTELKKYFNVDNGNYDSLKGLRFKTSAVYGWEMGTMRTEVDYISVRVYYNSLDISPIMKRIIGSEDSWVKCKGISAWQNTGVADGDSFIIGESTSKIMTDVSGKINIPINMIGDQYNTGIVNILPNSDVIATWNFSSEADYFDSIDQNDASYIRADFGDDAEYEEFECTAFTLTAYHVNAYVSKLTLYVKAKDSGDSKDFSASLYYDGSWQTPNISETLTGSYVTYSVTHDGLNLDQADLNAIKMRFRSDIMGGGETISVSYAYIKVEWTVDARFSKYMARWFRGTNCLEVLNAVRLLEGAFWIEDYVDNKIIVIKLSDFPSSGISLTQADYEWDWEYEDQCNNFYKVEVYGCASYSIVNNNFQRRPNNPLFLKWIKKLGIEDENIKIFQRKGFPFVGMGYRSKEDVWLINYSDHLKDHNIIHKIGYLWLYKKLNILNIVKKNVAENGEKRDSKIKYPFSLIFDAIIYRKLFTLDKSFFMTVINEYLEAFQTSFYNGFPKRISNNMKICCYIEQYLMYNYLYPKDVVKKHGNNILYELLARQKEIIEDSDVFNKKVFRNINKILRKFDSIKETLTAIKNYTVELLEKIPYWDREYLEKQFDLVYGN